MNLKSLENLPDLWKETYDLVAQVPEGRVTTYGEVAKALGDIVASRFVGLAMSKNDDIVRVPCRRVVQSDGSVGGYTGGGPSKKARLLRREGVRVSGNRITDLDKLLFREFETRYPLKRLRLRQRALKRKLSIAESSVPVSQVAGIDLSYRDDTAYAAMVVFDYQSGCVAGNFVTVKKVEFPYVPTYLAFRELPALTGLLKNLDRDTVIMFDGNGILHPEGFGIASQLGVVFGFRSIGVAKKLLCGEVSSKSRNGVSPVKLAREVIGHAITGTGASRPVYVSAGHGLSPAQACQIAQRFMSHRVPEPTRQAHIASEAARRVASQK
jgi:deoxyribonuclease V